MKKLILTCLIILFVIFSYARESVEDVAKWSKIDQKVHQIIRCESRYQHEGLWGKADEYGIAQFKYETFYWLAKLAHREDLDWQLEKDQRWLLRWALENGYGRHWTCYKGG